MYILPYILLALFWTWGSSSLQASPEDSLGLQTKPIIQATDTFSPPSWNLSLEAGKVPGHFDLVFQTADKDKNFLAPFQIKGETHYIAFRDGEARFPYMAKHEGELVKIQNSYQSGAASFKHTELWHLRLRSDGSLRSQYLPLFWSILPPLVAIILALLTKQVILSLFLGIFTGSWLSSGMPLEPYYFLRSLFRVLDGYLLEALADKEHLSVILFSLLIGGLVALISRNGGMVGIVERLAPLARTGRSTQLVTWFLGIAIFFDDYANSLIVGNTMRPLSDKFRISREKLAYIVDSTAAPVASIAFITTWIGAELGYIGGAMKQLEGMNNAPGAYSVFLSSLSYSFYAYFTLIFILMLVFSGRDFGPMYQREAETRMGKLKTQKDSAEKSELDDLEPVPGAPRRWFNGLIPVAVVVLGTLWGLIDTGMTASYGALVELGKTPGAYDWSSIWAGLGALDSEAENPGLVRKLGILIGNANSYSALLWASLSALLVTIGLNLSQRIMNLHESIETAIQGFKTMLPALLILLFAWGLAGLTKELATADFLTSALGDSVSPYMLPALVFILSAVIAFSTGSSWSTMAILYPIAIPLTWTLSRNAGLSEAESLELLYNVVAIVLSASVLGDHCSPISDTTILSSLASGCDHIQHVRTQMPYALFVGGVSLFMAYFSTALGLGFILNFALGLALLAAGLWLFGKKTPTYETD